MSNIAPKPEAQDLEQRMKRLVELRREKPSTLVAIRGNHNGSEYVTVGFTKKEELQESIGEVVILTSGRE